MTVECLEEQISNQNFLLVSSRSEIYLKIIEDLMTKYKNII